MRVFLLKDVEKVGMSGEIIKVADGYATNFLFPRKFAVEVTADNEQGFSRRIKSVEKRQEVIASKTSMLAEKIKNLKLTIKSKVHKAHDGNENELYGAIRESMVVDALAEHGVVISKNQVEFERPIKTTGLHTIIIKLSNKLQPKVAIKIIPE